MSNDLVKDLTAIRRKGGTNFSYKRVNSDGSDTTVPDTWHDGVYRQASEISFDEPIETSELESGELVDGEEGVMTTNLEITSAQDDASIINFLKDEVKGKYFAIFLERGKSINGKVIEFFIPIVKIARSWSSKSGERKPVLKCKFLYNEDIITPASVPTYAKAVAASYAVAAGAYFTPVETT